MNNKVLAVLGLALLSFGCGTSPPPIAGGKPVEHWLAAAHDPDAKVRTEAIRKLGNIGRKQSSALDAVFNALADTEPSVRREAIFAVVRNRSEFPSALPILARMQTEDPDPQIRALAEEVRRNLSN